MRHLRMYRAIQRIHRRGSIRKAAADLAVSPSALNRSVQAFEDELTFPVFERVPGGVRLSDAGELLLDMIDRHLVEFGALRRQLGALRDGDVGELRISIGADIAGGAVLRAVGEMERDYPGISIEIVQDDTIERLKRRLVHLALLTNPATDEAVEVIYVHRAPLLAWHLQDGAPAPSGLWDLAAERLIVPPDGTGTRAAFSHVLRRNRLTPRALSSAPAGQVTQRLSAAARLAIFPKPILERNTGGPSLLPLPFALGEVQISALRPARLPLTRPAQAFLAALQTALEGSD